MPMKVLVADDEPFFRRSEARFSHGICPDCYATVMKALAQKAER